MKKIVLIPNVSKDPDLIYTRKAASLLVEHGFSVVCDKACPTVHDKVVHCQGKDLYENATAIVVLGGDGSILREAEMASLYGIPILAVNLGRLGYIAQLEKNDIEELPKILASDFKTESRSMLSVSLYRKGKAVFQNLPALNDAVISKANGYGIIEFDLYCGEEKISFYRGDGMIASTATGSTAYAMSAGGAVIDSSLRIIEITPICAHSLKARPIVFSGTATLSAVIYDSLSAACLTLDGDRTTVLEANDRVEITLSDRVTKLVSVTNSFCQVLFHKMSDL